MSQPQPLPRAGQQALSYEILSGRTICPLCGSPDTELAVEGDPVFRIPDRWVCQSCEGTFWPGTDEEPVTYETLRRANAAMEDANRFPDDEEPDR